MKGGRPLVSETISRLVAYQPGRSIEEISRELGIADVVKLASNENPLGPSPLALEAISRALRGIHRYPDDGAPELREALASRLSVTPDQIVLTGGITELIELLVRTFTGPEDHALVSAGSFVAYKLFLAASAVPFTEVPLRDRAIDLTALAAAVQPETRLVFLPNPNNPTGTRFGAAELERFLAAIPADLLLVLDEAYLEFLEGDDLPDAVGILRRRPRTVVARGFSKAHGLAGLRLGYGVCSPEVASYLLRVRRPFSVNRLSLVAGRAALEDREHLERTVALTRQGRAFLAGALAELGLAVIESHANFVAVELGSELRVQVITSALLQRGLVVRPVASFGLPGHARISVGTVAENERLVLAMQALAREGLAGQGK